MTLAETKELIEFAKAQGVRELSAGDVHVLFSTVEAQPVRAAPVDGSTLPTPPSMPLADDEVSKLADDPDLFLHVDGRPDTLEGAQ